MASVSSDPHTILVTVQTLTGDIHEIRCRIPRTIGEYHYFLEDLAEYMAAHPFSDANPRHVTVAPLTASEEVLDLHGLPEEDVLVLEQLPRHFLAAVIPPVFTVRCERTLPPPEARLFRIVRTFIEFEDGQEVDLSPDYTPLTFTLQYTTVDATSCETVDRFITYDVLRRNYRNDAMQFASMEHFSVDYWRTRHARVGHDCIYEEDDAYPVQWWTTLHACMSHTVQRFHRGIGQGTRVPMKSREYYDVLDRFCSSSQHIAEAEELACDPLNG